MGELFPVKYSDTGEPKVLETGEEGIMNGDFEIINPRVVYVLLAKDNTVKVGITSDFKRRISAIQSASGKVIKNSFKTEICSNAHVIETEAKRKFCKDNICGEWFSCDFDEMVRFVKCQFLRRAEVNYISKEERNNHSKKFMQFVEKISEQNELKSSFFNAAQTLLAQIWAYQYVLEMEKEYDYSSKVFSIYERIWDWLMDLPEFYTEEQYDFLMSYDSHCIDMVKKPTENNKNQVEKLRTEYQRKEK